MADFVQRPLLERKRAMQAATPRPYVAYYRVSTAKQGRSGLGLEAQRKAVVDFVGASHGTILSEHTEIESGQSIERRALRDALASCRLYRATLVIAKLDRLSRNVAFIAALMEAGVAFEAVDFPKAHGFTLHIMAAVAEHEAKLISQRTRAALEAARARGVKLGGFRGRSGTAQECAHATSVRTLKALRRISDLTPLVQELQSQGFRKLREVARELNARRVNAARGGTWSPSQVRSLLGAINRNQEAIATRQGLDTPH